MLSDFRNPLISSKHYRNGIIWEMERVAGYTPTIEDLYTKTTRHIKQCPKEVPLLAPAVIRQQPYKKLSSVSWQS